MPEPVTIPVPKKQPRGTLQCDVCGMLMTSGPDGQSVPSEPGFMWAPRVEGTTPSRPPVHGPEWHLCVVCAGCTSVMNEGKATIYDLLRHRGVAAN